MVISIQSVAILSMPLSVVEPKNNGIYKNKNAHTLLLNKVVSFALDCFLSQTCCQVTVCSSVFYACRSLLILKLSLCFRYPICLIVIFQLQGLMVRRFFLQPKLDASDKFKPLAVNNRFVKLTFCVCIIFMFPKEGIQ